MFWAVFFLCFTQFDGRSNRLSNKFNDTAPLSVEKMYCTEKYGSKINGVLHEQILWKKC